MSTTVQSNSSPIRIAGECDAHGIQSIYAPIVAKTAISFETEVPSVEEMAKRIKNILPDYPWLVYEVDGKVAGYAYASQYRTRRAYQWTAEVTVYVDPDHHGRGIGKSLYQSLFKILVRQGYFIAIAGITCRTPLASPFTNPWGLNRSETCPLGFKFGAWHDVGWWQLELQPLTHELQDPVPFREMTPI